MNKPKSLFDKIRKRFGPGLKLPSHAQKQAVLREFARMYGLRCLVETGTLHGDMVAAMQPYFQKIISIELSDRFYREACRRFEGVANVELIHGDSAKEIARVVARLREPALFWLDAHYSGGNTARGDNDTPVGEELRAILKPGLPDHVILIDDARCFGNDPAYPSLEQVRQLVQSVRPGWRVEVKNDCIRIFPK
jgi:hypothetical protein